MMMQGKTVSRTRHESNRLKDILLLVLHDLSWSKIRGCRKNKTKCKEKKSRRRRSPGGKEVQEKRYVVLEFIKIVFIPHKSFPLLSQNDDDGNDNGLSVFYTGKKEMDEKNDETDTKVREKWGRRRMLSSQMKDYDEVKEDNRCKEDQEEKVRCRLRSLWEKNDDENLQRFLSWLLPLSKVKVSFGFFSSFSCILLYCYPWHVLFINKILVMRTPFPFILSQNDHFLWYPFLLSLNSGCCFDEKL